MVDEGWWMVNESVVPRGRGAIRRGVAPRQAESASYERARPARDESELLQPVLLKAGRTGRFYSERAYRGALQRHRRWPLSSIDCRVDSIRARRCSWPRRPSL